MNEITKVRTDYREFEINVERSGPILYFSIFRINDGWEMFSSFSETTESISNMVKILKGHVEYYLEHPQDYDE